jgi:hypothetical protein
MNQRALSCDVAREHLSARLDGETRDERALSAHLASCEGCRGHEHALLAFAADFARLRAEPLPAADLWPAVERRLRRRPAALLARAAAALVGFLSIALAARVLDSAHAGRERPRERHLLEHLAPARTDELFASLPEYRVLRAFPVREETR